MFKKSLPIALSAIYAQLKSSNRDKIFLQTIKLMQMKEKILQT